MADAFLIKAIPHIRILEANQGKLAALDALWLVYKDLCQRYVTHFCTVASPDPAAVLVFESHLSQRWQRVAVQQAAGMAQSWRTNHDKALREFASRLADFEALSEAEQAKKKKPMWKEWALPELHQVCIQANVNVVKTLTDTDSTLELAASERGQFDYWLKVATLEKRQPVHLPIKLAHYHKEALAGHIPNRSVTLNRRKGVWWLTLTMRVAPPDIAPPTGVTGGDVGISNFLTDSRGQQYGSFTGDLAAQHVRDRAKRQRKAKLRTCLEKKGVTPLPSTSSVTGQRLARHVRQAINRAVNLFLDDHVTDLITLEALSVSTMRFKSKRMNAYLYASNLGHIPKQLKWGAAKRGLSLVYVNPAYSSQECPCCHFADRANRPTQQTFCCQECGCAAHADVVGAVNIARRAADPELARCRTVPAVKQLLARRHAVWRQENGYS